MHFRRAGKADVAAVVALVESAYRGDASRAGWTTEADLLDGQRTDAAAVSALIADPGCQILLAHDDAVLVGSLLLRDEESGAHLGMIAVRPTAQGKGIGRALLAEAERIARDELGRRTARMTVLAQRPELIAWYQRRGFEPCGRREPFPYGDIRVGLPRRSDLFFEVLVKTL